MGNTKIPVVAVLILALWGRGLRPALTSARADDGNSMRYEFKENLDRPIRVLRGDKYLLGRFDRAGNFIPGTLPRDVLETKSGPFVLYHEVNRPRGPDGIIWAAERETVYEFRSGILIPGVLVKTGDFVPTEGGKIIALKDYRYSANSPRIYNLPGVFLRIENGKVTGTVDPAPF